MNRLLQRFIVRTVHSEADKSSLVNDFIVKGCEILSLTDLQVELRSIEEHIERLYVEIETMKPKSINEEQKAFLKITRQAKQYPITVESLNLASHSQKILFISVLAHIISIDEDNLYEKLLYLCRISYGCGLRFDAAEIYKVGLKFDEEEVGRINEELTELRYVLLVEALIVANVTGKASSIILSEIAEIATLLNCNRMELQTISQVAKSKLTQNLDLLHELNITKIVNFHNVFDDYIPHEWIVKQRVACCVPVCLEGHFKGEYNFSPVINYKAVIVKQWKNFNDIVKKGDEIFGCQRPVSKRAKKKEYYIVKAPKCGKLFMVDYRVKSEIQNKNANNKYDTYRAVYVVSYFDNYNNFCEWLKTKTKLDIVNIYRAKEG